MTKKSFSLKNFAALDMTLLNLKNPFFAFPTLKKKPKYKMQVLIFIS